MTAATRLPVALFLLAAVTTAGRLLVLPVEASTNSRSTFFFSAKLGHSFSITKNRAKCRFHCTKHEADAQGLFCGERTTAGGSPRRCGLFFFAAQQQYQGKRKGGGGEFHCVGLANLAVLKQKERPRPALGIAAGVGMGKVTWQNGRSRSSRSCASPSRRRWNRPDGR